MTIKEYEKELRHATREWSVSKIYVKQNKQSKSVYVCFDDCLLLSIQQKENYCYMDFEGSLTGLAVEDLSVYIDLLNITYEFMRGLENESD